MRRSNLKECPIQGVKTAGTAFNGSHLWMFGGEPTTGLNGNAENVVQLAHVSRAASP